MTQDELTDDTIAEAEIHSGHVAPPGEYDTESVSLTLTISKAHWDEAVSSGTQAKVLIKWLEAQRIQ